MVLGMLYLIITRQDYRNLFLTLQIGKVGVQDRGKEVPVPWATSIYEVIFR